MDKAAADKKKLEDEIAKLKQAAPPPPPTVTMPTAIDVDLHGPGKCVPLKQVTEKMKEVGEGYSKDIEELEQQIADIIEK